MSILKNKLKLVKLSKLPYRIISYSSEDPQYPLSNLIQQNGKGWQSNRFCIYPQEILIQFNFPVNINQINVIINEKKIPTSIEFYNANTNNNKNNQFPLFFNYIGFIKLSSNTNSNYRARESRKIFLDINAKIIKVKLNRNYSNKYNIFCQVGLISLEFYGKPLINLDKINQRLLKDNYNFENEKNENKNEINELLDEKTKEKLKILNEQLESEIKKENYEGCKIIKKEIDKIKYIAREIYKLNKKKIESVETQDFDNATFYREEITKLKNTLLNKNNISIDNTMNNSINQSQEFDISKHNNHTHQLNNDISMMNFSTIIENENYKKILFSNKLNYSQSQKNIIKNNIIDYDDIILPVVFKKLNPNQSQSNLDENGIVDKGELEPLSKEISDKYHLLINYVGEDGLRKIFSKQILWKEEGFDIFISKIDDIFNEQKNIIDINKYIVLIMKMIVIFLYEKHPSIIIKTLDIFNKLLLCIKEQSKKFKMEYDFNLTSRILNLLKEKLGDISSRVRNKTVDLYCYMLQQNFCDYDNLLLELIEKDVKNYKKNDIYKVKSTPKLIMSKLGIFSKIFDEFDDAIKNKRTSLESFPYNILGNYLVMNINHPKSEVRKLTRLVISKYIKVFGEDKLKDKLKNVDKRELQKLINEIPSLQQLFPDINEIDNNLNNSNNSLDNSINNYSIITLKNITSRNPRSISQPKIRNKIRLKPIQRKIIGKLGGKNYSSSITKMTENNSNSNISTLRNHCKYCNKEFDKKNDLIKHYNEECPFFIKCKNCNENIEVKDYNNHLLLYCKSKSEYKQCKRCKEPIEIKFYDNHIKENKCNPAKNISSANRCPLCHCDIPPKESGFITHLIKEGCSQQKRKINL